MHKMRASIWLIMAATACVSCFSQEKPVENAPTRAEHFYKLVFRVVETAGDGSSPASRTYTQVVSTDRFASPSEIRVGDKVPVVSSMFATKAGDAPTESQYQYIEVGTEIDTRDIRDDNGELATYVTANLTSAAKVDDKIPQPVIRQCKWSSRVTVPIGKPTIIFSSDNASDKGKTELELTATPIH